MKKLLLIGTGVGIGYVLGARAGRPAYDRLVETVRRFGSGLDDTQNATRDVVAEAKHAGEEWRDRADVMLADAVDKVGGVLPGTRAGSPPRSPARVPGDEAGETRASDMANGF